MNSKHNNKRGTNHNKKQKKRSSFSRVVSSAMIMVTTFCLFTGGVVFALNEIYDIDILQYTNVLQTMNLRNGVYSRNTGESIPGRISATQRTYNVATGLNVSQNMQVAEYIPIPSNERLFIPWPFTVHIEPNFTSRRVGGFTPQEIIILHQQDGWAFTTTSSGYGWTYIASDTLYTRNAIPVFDNIDGNVIRWIGPQVVRVHERRGDWLRVDCCGEFVWINLEFEIPMYELEAFVGQFGNTVSVFYENMATGFSFGHNADRVYFGASATKAPFALYIYLKAERGETYMASVHAYTANDFWEGSGIIRHRYSVGATFTQQRLLHLMLTPSDNIATRILRRVHGLEGYIAFVESIGANPYFVRNLTYSYLSANDAGIFMREFYRYIMSGGRYSHDFRDNLLANRYPFIISDYPVASKSGWARNFGQAWHDMAIVFAPSPYTLALLSNRAGNASDRAVYNSISMFVQEFNSTWFPPMVDCNCEV